MIFKSKSSKKKKQLNCWAKNICQKVSFSIHMAFVVLLWLLKELSSNDIERCLYSIGDNHSFLRGARDPIDKMIVYPFHFFFFLPFFFVVLSLRMTRYLTSYFSPDRVEGEYSLAIAAGINGARLTHNHARFVPFSLFLLSSFSHNWPCTEGNTTMCYNHFCFGERWPMICSSCGFWLKMIFWNLETLTVSSIPLFILYYVINIISLCGFNVRLQRHWSGFE